MCSHRTTAVCTSSVDILVRVGGLGKEVELTDLDVVVYYQRSLLGPLILDHIVCVCVYETKTETEINFIVLRSSFYICRSSNTELNDNMKVDIFMFIYLLKCGVQQVFLYKNILFLKYIYRN